MNDTTFMLFESPWLEYHTCVSKIIVYHCGVWVHVETILPMVYWYSSLCIIANVSLQNRIANWYEPFYVISNNVVFSQV